MKALRRAVIHEFWSRCVKRRGSRFVSLVVVLWWGLFPLHVFAQSSSGRESANNLAALSESLEVLAERVSPAVVKVVATGYSLMMDEDSASGNLLTKQRSGGSGVILDTDGYIVTNAHVVEGAQRIQVLVVALSKGGPARHSILKPAGKVVDAQVVGIDQETDLAILKIAEKDLPSLELGDSDDLRPGQLVLAFGSPLGLENSATLGVVSSVARQLEPDDPMIYIQTDASINPGNSGGPLVDTKGRVVGINTFIFSQSGGSEGIGFAAPSNIVRHVYKQILKQGRVRRGAIGIYAQTISPTLAKGLRLSQDWGVIIGDVAPGSPAERVGLEVGDIVLTLDGKILENARQFDVNLYQRTIGDVVALEVLRGTEKIKLPVQVIERPGDLHQFAELASPEESHVPELGILGIDLTPKIISMFSIPRKSEGVLIAAVTSQGTSLFSPGDIIYSVNRAPVRSLAELRSEVAKRKAGDPLVVQIERLGQLMFISFEKE